MHCICMIKSKTYFFMCFDIKRHAYSLLISWFVYRRFRRYTNYKTIRLVLNTLVEVDFINSHYFVIFGLKYELSLSKNTIETIETEFQCHLLFSEWINVQVYKKLNKPILIWYLEPPSTKDKILRSTKFFGLVVTLQK